MTKTTKTAKTAKRTPKSAKANPDLIRTVQNVNRHVVVTNGVPTDASITYALSDETADLRKLAVKGGSMKALRAAVKALPVREAKVAKGLDTRNAPQTMKAVADQRRAKSATKAPAKEAKATAKAERKAARAAKAAPKADDTRKIKVLDKKFSFGGEGTSRRAAWDAVANGRTVAEFVKAGGKVKYLPRWVAAGAIALS